MKTGPAVMNKVSFNTFNQVYYRSQESFTDSSSGELGECIGQINTQLFNTTCTQVRDLVEVENASFLWGES